MHGTYSVCAGRAGSRELFQAIACPRNVRFKRYDHRGARLGNTDPGGRPQPKQRAPAQIIQNARPKVRSDLAMKGEAQLEGVSAVHAPAVQHCAPQRSLPMLHRLSLMSARAHCEVQSVENTAHQPPAIRTSGKKMGKRAGARGYR